MGKLRFLQKTVLRKWAKLAALVILLAGAVGGIIMRPADIDFVRMCVGMAGFALAGIVVWFAYTLGRFD